MYGVYYLIVRAGVPRVVTRRPGRLALDEVAYRLVVKGSDAWGKILPADLVVELPDPPSVEVEQ